MKTHAFVCPECKHEWSEEFGYDSEVMCRSCQTVWRLVFDKTGVWPPPEYRIDGRADHQPQFDVTIDGTKIPACMTITVEQESFAAHSRINYRMVARFYDDLDDDLINLVTGHSGDVTISILGHHPELKPMTLHVQVGGGPGSDTLTFHTDNAGDEFSREQMEGIWEKANKLQTARYECSRCGGKFVGSAEAFKLCDGCADLSARLRMDSREDGGVVR